ncbi:MAG: pentapeptide repeat-containing protein [Myxococcales bacterium]|nr:pentapeptide repeat-containing protein [Myxococcales bacterium]
MDRRGLLLFGLVLGLGCDGVEEAAADVELRSDVVNGQVLNTARFNGVQFNGVQFNGVQFNGSSFTGTLAGVTMSGVQFEGAEISVTVNGAAYTLRFDDIYPDPAQPGGDVLFYDISVREDAVGGWAPLCTNAAGGPVAAIPMANYWNYTTGARVDAPDVVTFACRGAALAKCVEWGYVPWRSATRCTGGAQGCSAVSLKEYHQACTRMVRADYCGDGSSFTFDGTPIDIYDALQPRLQTRSTLGNTDWTAEAEWGPNGAVCIGDELRMQLFDQRHVAYALPGCLGALDDAPNCGNLPASRPSSLVADAYCHAWTDDPSRCDPVYNDDRARP